MVTVSYTINDEHKIKFINQEAVITGTHNLSCECGGGECIVEQIPSIIPHFKVEDFKIKWNNTVIEGKGHNTSCVSPCPEPDGNGD